MIKHFLVSIIVVTFNSGKYVIDTLDSIKNQLYGNIELIITDDCSIDDTVPLVKRWVEVNKELFTRCSIIESHVNTGTAINCNRGLSEVTGDYVKFVAGDDMLLNNCISDLVEYCVDNNLKVAFSKAKPYYGPGITKSDRSIFIQEHMSKKFYDMPQKMQYKKMLVKSQISYSLIGGIYKKELLDEVGGFSDKYLIMEDYPFIFSIVSAGYKLNLLDKYTVMYRVRNTGNDISYKTSSRFKRWANDLIAFQDTELLPKLKQNKMILSIYDFYINRASMMIYIKSDSLISYYISRLIRYLSPITLKEVILSYYLTIKNKLTKKGE